MKGHSIHRFCSGSFFTLVVIVLLLSNILLSTAASIEFSSAQPLSNEKIQPNICTPCTEVPLDFLVGKRLHSCCSFIESHPNQHFDHSLIQKCQNVCSKPFNQGNNYEQCCKDCQRPHFPLWKISACCSVESVQLANYAQCCSLDNWNNLCVADQMKCCNLDQNLHLYCCDPKNHVYNALVITNPEWITQHCPIDTSCPSTPENICSTDIIQLTHCCAGFQDKTSPLFISKCCIHQTGLIYGDDTAQFSQCLPTCPPIPDLLPLSDRDRCCPQFVSNISLNAYNSPSPTSIKTSFQAHCCITSGTSPQFTGKIHGGGDTSYNSFCPPPLPCPSNPDAMLPAQRTSCCPKFSSDIQQTPAFQSHCCITCSNGDNTGYIYGDAIQKHFKCPQPPACPTRSKDLILHNISDLIFCCPKYTSFDNDFAQRCCIKKNGFNTGNIYSENNAIADSIHCPIQSCPACFTPNILDRCCPTLVLSPTPSQDQLANKKMCCESVHPFNKLSCCVETAVIWAPNTPDIRCDGVPLCTCPKNCHNQAIIKISSVTSHKINQINTDLTDGLQNIPDKQSILKLIQEKFSLNPNTDTETITIHLNPDEKYYFMSDKDHE